MMAGSRINSREEFINYGLRELGAPVVNINVDRQQLEDRVDDALDLFWEFHSDGSELMYLNHQVTEDDKTRGYIELPSDILSVLNILHIEGQGASGIATINLAYQAYITDLVNVNRIVVGGLSSYYISQSFITLMNNTFNSPKRLTFNHHHGRVTIHGGWEKITVGDWIAVECYKAVTEDTSKNIYNNRWLKKYVVALFKRQWGNNLIKYDGAQLPGGVTVNAQRIYDDGRADCDKLEEELRQDYEYPVDFMVA